MDSATPFQPWAGDDNRKNVKTEREVVDDAKLHRENVNPKHTQTASYDKESVAASSIVAGSSSSAGPVGVLAQGKESKMDPAKIASMQQIVENSLSQEGRQKVSQLLDAVEALSGTERLLLYLRLPTGVPPHDPLKQPVNPLGSRAELQQTVTWIQTHLEVDPDVSLPKQDVYDEYIAHCMSSNMKPLSTADFGKVMKQVYPTVRPRRLGTRGNSRYCYAGLRKKIKLEVPQLPDLGETSKEIISGTSRESERMICDWAETKLGVKLASISELSRHLASTTVPPGPASASPPLPALGPTSHTVDDPTGRQLMKHLKRKIQGTPGRPKKNKGVECAGESPPSTSYAHSAVKHEGAVEPYYPHPSYPSAYEARAPYPAYGAPPRAHPPPPHADYRAPYYEGAVYARDLTLPAPEPASHLPINLSSDASLDLSTEREWPRRRPPDPPPPPPPLAPPPPPPRLPLPGKKLILEAYQSETRVPPPPPPPDDFPRTEYLPKKMRAAEILGGKLAAARHALAPDAPSTSADRPAAFLEDPKNLTSRSKSTAAALAREEQEAASPTRAAGAGRAPTPERGRAGPPRRQPRDSCCGLDGINIKTGVICEERHSEILNRERVISICNIDKHDLDDYLNEGNSQEHEEELSKYFQQRDAEADAQHAHDQPFLEAGPDPQDDHSQGKNEKLSQLRELLAKNLKSQSGSSTQSVPPLQEAQVPVENSEEQHIVKSAVVSEGAFKPVAETNGLAPANSTEVGVNKHCIAAPNQNGTAVSFPNQNNSTQINNNAAVPHLYNGNSHAEPQSPTTRTQQYDFVPISDGCHSPGNFSSKSPLGFGQRGHSPSKPSKPVMMGGSLQTSPISHSTAASPFVSPRNTPVPRSRLCSRPIPKHNGKVRRRNPLSLGVADACAKQFAIPNDQKFLAKSSIKYCQPMSAPPSPNILSQYKNQMFACNSQMVNGNSNMCLNFLPNTLVRDNINGELAHPLSADPLSSEVSQFFQESPVAYRPGHDPSFRSQSVPLKQGMAIGLLSYTNTPVGSVPPTPVPNEFCDFGTLGDACDISRAGLNPETLDKIYDAIDSNNVLNHQHLLNANDTLANGCDALPEQTILADGQLNPYISSGNEHFSQSFNNDNGASDHVDDLLKRTNSMEFDLSDLVAADRNKYYMSRSVPSTPLPFKRTAPNLQIDSRRSRELFPTENYSNVSNGLSSKSVPSTPQLAEERSVFSYSNRDFLINGNSVEMGGSGPLHESVVDSHQGLTSPLHDILGEDTLDPLTPAADLLADLDKMDGNPYDL